MSGESIFLRVCKAPDLAASLRTTSDLDLARLSEFCDTLPDGGIGGLVKAQVVVEAAHRWFSSNAGGGQ